MAVMDKPELDEALLIHYGIKGMKWGARRGRGTTGITRTRGARIDKNNRTIMRTKEAQSGKGRIRDRVVVKASNLIMGKQAAQNYRNYKIKDMKDQNARLRGGKATVSDKMSLLMRTTPLEMVLSVKPK
jgi:hypothetical protein